MRGLACCLLAALGAWAARADLVSAAWGTEPAAPLYVGQAYFLTLTLTTGADEEIASFVIDQGPSRNPDAQRREERDGKRLTTFLWRQSEPTPRLAAIPLTRVVAEVTRVQAFGFARFADSSRQGVGAAAFSYDVVELPGEAAGAPIGDFTLTLGVDSETFEPGDVRRLTATLEAREGTVPQTLDLALEPCEGVRVWPFRVVGRTDGRLVAEASVAIEAEGPVTLRLRPMRAFDLGTRALAEVAAAPLTLRPLTAAEKASAPDAAGPVPLRFAPSAAAPVLGTVGEETPVPAGGRVEGWVRVRAGGRTGWVREDALKGGGR